MNLPRLLRTARYLRPRQIWARAANRPAVLAGRARALNNRAAPPRPEIRGSLPSDIPCPSGRWFDAEKLARGEFAFVNEAHRVGWPSAWAPRDASRLWQYNLHYFEWAWALEYEMARDAALDWIENHPLSKDAVGWEPYPVSLRIQNWLSLFLGRHFDRTQNNPVFLDALWESLWRQAEWLSRNIEWRLMANHLFENTVALSVIGKVLKGSDADRWRSLGEEILLKEIPEQILPDGMHFERSPMYHQRILYSMLLLVEAGESRAAGEAKRRLPQMIHALQCMTHPDGQIALFNDAAMDIYTSPGELIEWAKRLGVHAGSPNEITSIALPDAGCYGARTLNNHYIVCDAGPIGPDYQPGHAHGDMFSFELSLFGMRVICDSGVLSYKSDSDRAFTRSTAAHNTVEIEGRDQCEFWSAFRVGRRARPHDVKHELTSDGFNLSGWHDGYFHLPGKPRHERAFQWRGANGLSIIDRVVSQTPTSWAVRFHFAPICKWDVVSREVIRIEFGAGMMTLGIEGAEWKLEENYINLRYADPKPSIIAVAKAHAVDHQIKTTINYASPRNK